MKGEPKSELKHHVVRVTERDKIFLDHFFKGRRTTEEDDCVGTGSWQVIFHHITVNPANTIFPVSLRLNIDRVIEVEAFLIIQGELVKFFLQQNIFNASVSKQQ
jgi:hypothetical protein